MWLVIAAEAVGLIQRLTSEREGASLARCATALDPAGQPRAVHEQEPRMEASSVRVVAMAAAAVFLAACQAQPIPTTLVPGTTFVLPIQASSFGSSVSPDTQRGDLVAALCPTSNPSCAPLTSQTQCTPGSPSQGVYLGSHYVTEVMPSPASAAGLRGFVNGGETGGAEGLVGQDLAFLDVPSNACAGQYVLSIRLRGGPVGQNESIVAQAWTVNVAAATAGTANPNTATAGSPVGGFGSMEMQVAPDLSDLVPQPTVNLRLNVPNFTTMYPAAAEIEVNYPATKVDIHGAYQFGHLGLKSMLDWKDDPNGTVKLTLVDPTRCTQNLRIVFTLKAAETTPVNALTEFTISTQRLYDLNGALITSNPYIVANPYNYAPICGT